MDFISFFEYFDFKTVGDISSIFFDEKAILNLKHTEIFDFLREVKKYFEKNSFPNIKMYNFHCVIMTKDDVLDFQGFLSILMFEFTYFIFSKLKSQCEIYLSVFQSIELIDYISLFNSILNFENEKSNKILIENNEFYHSSKTIKDLCKNDYKFDHVCDVLRGCQIIFQNFKKIYFNLQQKLDNKIRIQKYKEEKENEDLSSKIKNSTMENIFELTYDELYEKILLFNTLTLELKLKFFYELKSSNHTYFLIIASQIEKGVCDFVNNGITGYKGKTINMNIKEIIIRIKLCSSFEEIVLIHKKLTTIIKNEPLSFEECDIDFVLYFIKSINNFILEINKEQYENHYKAYLYNKRKIQIINVVNFCYDSFKENISPQTTINYILSIIGMVNEKYNHYTKPLLEILSLKNEI